MFLLRSLSTDIITIGRNCKVKKQTLTQFKYERVPPALRRLVFRAFDPAPDDLKAMAQRNEELRRYDMQVKKLRAQYFERYAKGRDKRVEAALIRRPAREARKRSWEAQLRHWRHILDPVSSLSPEERQQRAARLEWRRQKQVMRAQIRSQFAELPKRHGEERRLAVLAKQVDKQAPISTVDQLNAYIDRLSLVDQSNKYQMPLTEAVGKLHAASHNVHRQPISGLPRVDAEALLPKDMFPKGLRSAIPRKYHSPPGK